MVFLSNRYGNAGFFCFMLHADLEPSTWYNLKLRETFSSKVDLSTFLVSAYDKLIFPATTYVDSHNMGSMPINKFVDVRETLVLCIVCAC
jgi:hypothetical protein